MNYLIFGMGGIILGIGLLVGWPFVLIWSFNALFTLAIPITLKTWFAALLLSATFLGKLRTVSSD